MFEGRAAALRDHRVAKRIPHFVESARVRTLAFMHEHEVHAVGRWNRTRPGADRRREHTVGERRPEAARELVARLKRLLGAVQERIAEVQRALGRSRAGAQPREHPTRLALAVGAEVELRAAHARRALIGRRVALVLLAQRGLVGFAARRLVLEIEPDALDQPAPHHRVGLVHAHRERVAEQRRVVAVVRRAREAQVLHQPAEHHRIVALVAARERLAIEQLLVGGLCALRPDHDRRGRGAPPESIGREQHRAE